MRCFILLKFRWSKFWKNKTWMIGMISQIIHFDLCLLFSIRNYNKLSMGSKICFHLRSPPVFVGLVLVVVCALVFVCRSFMPWSVYFLLWMYLLYRWSLFYSNMFLPMNDDYILLLLYEFDGGMHISYFVLDCGK